MGQPLREPAVADPGGGRQDAGAGHEAALPAHHRAPVHQGQGPPGPVLAAHPSSLGPTLPWQQPWPVGVGRCLESGHLLQQWALGITKQNHPPTGHSSSHLWSRPGPLVNPVPSCSGLWSPPTGLQAAHAALTQPAAAARHPRLPGLPHLRQAVCRVGRRHMRAQVVPAHAWRMIMPARPLQRLLATLRPVMEWSDLLAKRQRAQSLRREFKGCGRLRMPNSLLRTWLTGRWW